MKHVAKILVIVLLLTSFGIVLSGCTINDKDVKFSEPNLMKDATVSSYSKNVQKPLKAIDSKNGTSLDFKQPMRSYIDFDLGIEKEFNSIVLKEKTDAVDLFNIYILKDEKWQLIYQQDRIGTYRMCYVEKTVARNIRLEFAKVRQNVKLKEVEIYNLAKTNIQNFRVTQYLVMMDKDAKTGKMTYQMQDNLDNEGFSGNYDVVTDIMLIGALGLDKDAKITYGIFTKEEFAKNLTDLRTIIGTRNVKIRATIFVNPYKDHKEDAKFLMDNETIISDNLKNFVEEFNLDGIDYDWEYPENGTQWKAYNNLIINTAKFTKVTVALPTWGIRLSKKAKSVIEFINLMTYDLFDERGDHSNIYVGGLEGINKLLKEGFEPQQICLGIPTYGRTVDRSGMAWPELSNYPELGKWGNIVENFDYTDTIDDVIINKTNTAYLNGYAMSRDKTALALHMKIGGIMIFRARCDAPFTYKYSVHRAIQDAILNLN